MARGTNVLLGLITEKVRTAGGRTKEELNWLDIVKLITAYDSWLT